VQGAEGIRDYRLRGLAKVVRQVKADGLGQAGLLEDK